MKFQVKSYKKQIEEAEEIAALNLAKYRKVAGALGDAEASADANEQVKEAQKEEITSLTNSLRQWQWGRPAPSPLPLVFKLSNLPEQHILTNMKTDYWTLALVD